MTNKDRTEVTIGERFRAGDSILALSTDYKMDMASIEKIIRSSMTSFRELDPEENISLRNGTTVYNLHNCKFEILNPITHE